MGAPNVIAPSTTSGGIPVGGAGTPGTIPLWNTGTSLTDSAVTQTDGAILSVTLTSGGTGYTNGNYPQVALTNVTGTGTGATADIVVAGGIVTSFALRNPGSGYVVGSQLSCASIGAGSGFVVTIATIGSSARASGNVSAPRISAGGTLARAGVDVSSGALLADSFDDLVAVNGITTANIPIRATIFSNPNISWAASNSQHAGVASMPSFSFASASSAPSANAYYARAVMASSPAAQSGTLYGANLVAIRALAADLSTNLTVVGLLANALVSATPGSATTNFVIGVNAIAQANSTNPHTVSTLIGSYAQAFVGAGNIVTTGHGFFLPSSTGTGTFTTFYGLRLQAMTAPTITNRYNIAQEDTLGANYLRSKTFFGAAVGTAAATNASVEVTAQGALTGDVRLNSASAVFDASNSSTNGTKYFNRGGTGISSTTQSYYEEGSYTPTTTGGWTGTLAGTWTRIGRKVFITINVTGSPNGSTGASTLTLPAGLAPARGGAGIRVKTASGTALGNGVVSVDNVSGLIQISTAVTSDNDAKTIQCEYEV